VAEIPKHSRVFVGSATGVPRALVAALVGRARREHLELELVAGYLLEPLPEPPDCVRVVSLQPSAALWATAAIRTDVVPARYSDYERIFRPGAALQLDVALAHVSRPGLDGRHSLGTSVGAAVPAVRDAARVIAQVNSHMPYTLGDGEITLASLDVLVMTNEPLLEYVPRAPTARMGELAERVAAQVPNGACVQIGVGSIPAEIGRILSERRAVTAHSGMLSDWCMTAQRRTGPMAAAEIVGSRRLYDWTHRNSAVRMLAAAASHGKGPDPAAGPFYAINSGLQVALDGAVNAERVGSRIVSGPGGLPDFASLAALRAGGVSIVTVAATSSSGDRSNVVAELAPGTPATLPTWLADRVVSEHGTASLRDRSLRERAAALVGIAHPDFADAVAGASAHLQGSAQIGS
jgi:acyl-CoA hydrolase